jgi:PAS domain-containing protein
VSQESKQQILQPLSVLRPKFRVSALAITFRHTPMLSASLGRSTIPARYGGCHLPSDHFLTVYRRQDLVFIEEAFERLLLDYDRVFSAMGIPACLWRRTGEIYKANREFTELVGVDSVMFRDVSEQFFSL